MGEISKELERWEKEKLEPVLKKYPERKEKFETLSKIEVKRVYTPEDIKKFDYMQDLGFPQLCTEENSGR